MEESEYEELQEFRKREKNRYLKEIEDLKEIKSILDDEIKNKYRVLKTLSDSIHYCETRPHQHEAGPHQHEAGPHQPETQTRTQDNEPSPVPLRMFSPQPGPSSRRDDPHFWSHHQLEAGPHQPEAGPHQHEAGPHQHEAGPHQTETQTRTQDNEPSPVPLRMFSPQPGPSSRRDDPHFWSHHQLEAGPHQPEAGPHQHEAGPHQHEAGPHQHEAGPHQHEAGPHQHEAGPHQHEAGPHQPEVPIGTPQPSTSVAQMNSTQRGPRPGPSTRGRAQNVTVSSSDISDDDNLRNESADDEEMINLMEEDPAPGDLPRLRQEPVRHFQGADAQILEQDVSGLLTFVGGPRGWVPTEVWEGICNEKIHRRFVTKVTKLICSGQYYSVSGRGRARGGRQRARFPPEVVDTVDKLLMWKIAKEKGETYEFSYNKQMFRTRCPAAAYLYDVLTENVDGKKDDALVKGVLSQAMAKA